MMLRSWRQRPLYAYLIGGMVVITAVLYGNHLLTGVTPSRVAIHIDALDFDIFWYGIWIVGGIALGAYVMSQLLWARATAVFGQVVPLHWQGMPLTALDLPDGVRHTLVKNKINTVGELVWQMGLEPRHVGLKGEGITAVAQSLAKLPDMEMAWLTDAPWRQWNPEHVWNGIGWCLVLGIVGARLYHVLTPSPSMAAVGIESPLDYFRNPYQLINLRNGGLGIYGGMVGGIIGLWWYTRRHRLPTLAWADLAAIGMALGQTFGRWGNFFNQELYGRPTDLPWAVTIDPLYRLPDYSEFSRFHPAFLYESLWNLLTFLLLINLYRRSIDRLQPGDLMALYLIAYAVGRSLLELVRLDSRTIQLAGFDLSLSIATAVSIVVALFMGGWLILRRRVGHRLH